MDEELYGRRPLMEYYLGRKAAQGGSSSISVVIDGFLYQETKGVEDDMKGFNVASSYLQTFLLKRGIIVVENMVIQPPCPLSFGEKHAGPLDRLDPDR